MAHSGAKFGRRQEATIEALLTQPTIEKAARAAGIGTRTLYRWLRLPEFQAAYRQAKHDAFSQSIARLQYASSAAATALLKLTVDPGTPPSVRVRAADSVLDHAMKATEIQTNALEAEREKELATKLGMELLAILRGMGKNAIVGHHEALGDLLDERDARPDVGPRAMMQLKAQ